MSEELDRFELASTLTLFVGMLCLGVALGTALGLQQLQSSCVAVGSLPHPGSPIPPTNLEGNACWEGATSLQTIANGAGIASALLLLSGAVIDRFDDEIRDSIGMEVRA